MVALVVDNMRRPEQPDLMVDAVVPVIEDIVCDQRADPDPPIIGPKREQRQAIINNHVYADAQCQHEGAGELAENAGGQWPTASLRR